ncbi:MAG: hypothetical protein P8J45_12230 [Phycisphaerales bacterium]|nr:hypothetical protein [Phycisphaerales bacterium]
MIKRLTICTAGVFLFGLGLAACEDAGKRGNEIDESKVITAPEDDPNVSISGSDEKK